LAKLFTAGAAFLVLATQSAFAAGGDEAAAGEANLKLPDLSSVQFMGVNGHKLLLLGILFCIFGLMFGMVIYTGLKNLPVHSSMGEISQLIWETCKTIFSRRASSCFCSGFHCRYHPALFRRAAEI